MNNRRRILIATAVFLALLLIYLADVMRGEHAKDIEQEAKRVILLSANEITSFTLANRSGAMSFVRDAGGWRMAAPLNSRANAAAIQAMLENLAGATRHHAFNKKEIADLAAYGLNRPDISIAVEGRFLNAQGGGAASRLFVGKSSPTGQYYATLAGGGDAFTISGYLRNQLNRDAFELRDKALVQADPLSAFRLAIANRRGRIVAVKNASGGWMVTEPATFPADKNWTDNLIIRLSKAQIARFADAATTAPAQIGLEKPSISVTVDYLGKPDEATSRALSSTLLVGRLDEATQTYAARHADNPQAFWIAAQDIKDVVSIEAGDFRKRELFDFSLNDVQRIEARAGQNRVVLAKDADGKWRFEDEPGLRVDQKKAQRLVKDLAFLEASQFVSDSPTLKELESYQLAPVPMTAFLISVKGAPRPYGLSLGRLSDTKAYQVYAMAADTSSVVTVALTEPRQFLATKNSFADYHLFPGAESCKPAKIELAAGTLSGALTKDKAGKWSLRSGTETASRSIQAYKIDNLLYALAAIESKTALAADSPAVQRAGLDNPSITVEMWKEAEAASGGGAAPSQPAAAASARPEEPFLRVAAGAMTGGTNAIIVQTGASAFHVIAIEDADSLLGAIEAILK